MEFWTSNTASKHKVVLVSIILYSLTSVVNSAVYNAPCTTKEECVLFYNSRYICEDQHCRRPEFSIGLMDWVGYIFVILVSSISNAGGMGAGSIIIPAYMGFFSFVATDAIPLSKLTILAGALTSLILNWNQRDPKNKARFLIDYNMATFMIPLLLSGTQIGVLLAKFLPPAVIWIGLLSYLLYSTAKVFKRYLSPHQSLPREPES